MKNLLLLGLMIISLASCSTDEISVQEKYAHEYKLGANKGKMMRINIQLKTTYAHSKVSLYDVENITFIDITKGAEFSNYYELEYGKRYIFKFERDNDELISSNDEPFVGIYIYNTTNGKILDEYEKEGCVIGYNYNFLVL